MTLKQSFYDGGTSSKVCEICNTFIHAKFGKCSNCAKEIANKIADEFNENIGHHMTEAILATGNEKLITGVVEGAKLLEDKNNGKP